MSNHPTFSVRHVNSTEVPENLVLSATKAISGSNFQRYGSRIVAFSASKEFAGKMSNDMLIFDKVWVDI